MINLTGMITYTIAELNNSESGENEHSNTKREGNDYVLI